MPEAVRGQQETPRAMTGITRCSSAEVSFNRHFDIAGDMPIFFSAFDLPNADTKHITRKTCEIE